MGYLNTVLLVGRLGDAAKVSDNPSATGSYTVRLSVATTDAKGHTDWHKVVAFRKDPSRYLTYEKGDQVFVEGRLQTRSYEDKQGVKQWQTNVVANRLENLSRKSEAPQEEWSNYDSSPMTF